VLHVDDDNGALHADSDSNVPSGSGGGNGALRLNRDDDFEG
jgi:hypothetical protein